MKRLLLTFLCSLYFISATGLTELLRVDALFGHFIETKVKNESITFLDFLVMHYLTDDENKADDANDKELPFKSATSFFYANLQAAQVSADNAEKRVPLLTKENRFGKHEFVFNSNYFAQIWLPPELC